MLDLVNLDLLTYAGNLKECETNPNYKFIHFAAESHVDNSIKNPGVFVQTFTLIDVAYKYWMSKPFTYKEKYKNSIIYLKKHHMHQIHQAKLHLI